MLEEIEEIVKEYRLLKKQLSELECEENEKGCLYLVRQILKIIDPEDINAEKIFMGGAETAYEGECISSVYLPVQDKKERIYFLKEKVLFEIIELNGVAQSAKFYFFDNDNLKEIVNDNFITDLLSFLKKLSLRLKHRVERITAIKTAIESLENL
jgi:hypothetical protein